jgi:phosphoserine aminotransferase
VSQISFYPGPSRIYSNATEYIYEAYMSGILSANHRSEDFMTLVGETKQELREKLLIPSDYTIAFVSSATECWEIISQSLVRNSSAIAHNGSFGQKWAGLASKIDSQSTGIEFGLNEALPVSQFVATKADVLGIVQNETSNGTQIAQGLIQQINKEKGKDQLVAIDVTSSLGGVALDLSQGDIWFASVQKCLGLPAGLALLILSPRAVDRAAELNRDDQYNSLVKVIANSKLNQTHCTPNTLGIYLLQRTQNFSKGVKYLDNKLLQRYEILSQFVDQQKDLNWLIDEPSVRSSTVLSLTVKNPEKLKKAALSKGIVIGSGYGPWKTSSIRIANFPAIKGKEIEKLVKFFSRYFD